MTNADWGVLTGWAATVIAVLAGMGWTETKYRVRRLMTPPPPPEPKPKHECLGKVIRCVPRVGAVTVGHDLWGGGEKRNVEGTDILLRCACGKWWTQWMPGLWTVSDFNRTEPADMDQAIKALSSPPEQEKEGGDSE